MGFAFINHALKGVATDIKPLAGLAVTFRTTFGNSRKEKSWSEKEKKDKITDNVENNPPTGGRFVGKEEIAG